MFNDCKASTHIGSTGEMYARYDDDKASEDEMKAAADAFTNSSHRNLHT